MKLFPELRDATEVLTVDDQATAREAEFLARALHNHHAQAAADVSAPGRCANCGAVCMPRAVYCDLECRADHEDRRLRQQRLKGR